MSWGAPPWQGLLMAHASDSRTRPYPPRLGPRDLARHSGWAPNTLRYWYKTRKQDGPLLSALRILRNYAVVELMKYFPSLSWKNVILRRVLGMKIGRNVTITPGTDLDFFFPELIEIGENTIIGLNAMIITHEFFHDHYRTGPVRIGANVIVGARTIVLAGVSIAEGATISAGSFVNRSVPEGTLVRGNPIAIVARPSPS